MAPLRSAAAAARTSTSASRQLHLRRLSLAIACYTLIALAGVMAPSCASGEPTDKLEPRATQASVERQLDTPAAAPAISSSTSSSKPSAGDTAGPKAPAKPQKAAGQKKAAAALASQTNYDKYQLKASASSQSAVAMGSLAAAASSQPGESSGSERAGEKVKSEANNNGKPETAGSSASSSGVQPAHKKLAASKPKASSSFALLKRFLPSFMTSAAAAAAAGAAVSSGSGADKHTNQHSRSAPLPGTSGSAGLLLDRSSGPLSLASGKLLNLLASGATSMAKKRAVPADGGQGASAIPNHAPFFMRKSAADRQAVGGGAMGLASSLLSNPLKLGLLFSAPLLPSLLLTPLAIAGLSPAMSAINNFFGDDDEPTQQSAASGPLAALAGGPNSPIASILQATGVSSPALPTSGSESAGGSSQQAGTNMALKAFQSLFLGPSSTTERPLFNPGMFASSGIQNAAGSLASSMLNSNSASSSSSSASAPGSSQSRPLFGGSSGLLQTAASMISPSFAAPPSSSSSSSSSSSADSDNDDGPGLMQMASGVFEKVANYMGNEGTKDVGQASGGSSLANSPGGAASSPLATLANLASLSPFQLASLFAPTAFGSSLTNAGHSHSASGGSSAAPAAGHTHQRVGFFSTLRNFYDLFSSSFLRRQEVGDSNECQQRLVCELHQRAMNSKLFRRSLQSNLMELSNLDRNLLEQMKFSSQALQARVDPDTKAMLSDFLRATNSFKNGRELINCGQMFPKCSRVQLLAAANAHLSDPANGRTIGKFSQLMKKMKFKTNQQHQGQWKLRKPTKGGGAQPPQPAAPLDYLQVAPGASLPAGQKVSLAPVDSLKLAQQIMMLSQLNGQPQAQQQQISAMAGGQYAPLGQMYRQPAAVGQFSSAGQPNYSAGSLAPQYSAAPSQKLTSYTDAVPLAGQVYASSPTESPYFMAQSSVPVSSAQYPAAQQADSQQYSQQQPQQPQQQSNQYQSSYQNYAPSSLISAGPVVADQTMASQQQQQQAPLVNGQDIGNQQKQQQTNGKRAAAA